MSKIPWLYAGARDAIMSVLTGRVTIRRPEDLVNKIFALSTEGDDLSRFVWIIRTFWAEPHVWPRYRNMEWYFHLDAEEIERWRVEHGL